MPKIAQLHDGTQLAFPDDMPDEHMDMAVQQHMGVPPPVDPGDAVMQALQQIGALVQSVQQATAAVAHLAASIAQGQQQMTQAINQLLQMSAPQPQMPPQMPPSPMNQ